LWAAVDEVSLVVGKLGQYDRACSKPETSRSSWPWTQTVYAPAPMPLRNRWIAEM
jgi:hypothetical protein